jgi:lysophospholipase L1-like esterase
MKNYKPHHILLFVFAVLAILSPLVYFTPKGGHDIAGFNLRFLSFEKFLNPGKTKTADISDIIKDIDTTLIAEIIEDTLIKHENVSGSMGAPSGGKLITESATSIDFSPEGLSKLHQAFAKMDEAASGKKKVRILHYGDSQIEGDRMTSYIRQRLQEQFGGNGPGMIPAINVYHTISFKQTYSPNFQRYTNFGGQSLKTKNYGILNSAGRFTPELTDSIAIVNAKTIQEGWIEIEPSQSAYGRARQYSNVKLYYTSCYKPCGIKVYQNGAIIHEDSLIDDGKYHTMNLSFPTTPGKLKYVFTSAISPTILGFSLEGDMGVQVDNIGMRGSSGTFFGKIDQSLAAKIYNELNTELIIMQFGGNSVPYLKDSSSVRNYANHFKSQLQTIKRLRPSAAIIVIGPSDMSRLQEGEYVTYPMLPVLVRNMKKAALEVGAGYWDLYSAMGGYNSMPSWVNRGLAGPDYIHFSNKGASIASQFFYEALAKEYAKWKTE